MRQRRHRHCYFPKGSVHFVPIEPLFIERDCPFLTPVLYRGKPNESASIKYIAESIAQLKGISFEECVYQTTKKPVSLIVLASRSPGGGSY